MSNLVIGPYPLRWASAPQPIPIRSCLALCLLCGLAASADAPQWGQGFSRNMVVDEKNLAESCDPATGKNIKWSAELGSETYSTPVISGGKVFIGTNNQNPRDPRHRGDRGILLCLDEKTGKFLWQLVVPKMEDDPWLDWPNDGLCSPATVEGERVYVVSNRGEVLCLNSAGMANGNTGPYLDEGRHMALRGATPLEPKPQDADIIWLTDLFKTPGIWQMDSAHASILIHGDFLYVNTSNGTDNTHRKIRRPDAPGLVVLDKKTGRLVAQDDEHCAPRTIHSTWSSPALGEVNGQPRVFFGGGDAVLYAFEPLAAAPPPGEVAKLKKVWQADCDPAAPKENIFKWQDNRREGPSTIIAMPVFCNNRVYISAGGDPWHGKTKSWLKCFDAVTGRELWSYQMQKYCTSTVASAGGLVFVADWGRTMHCLDAETGQMYWQHQARGEVWSSPLIADGKVHFTDCGGMLWIFAVNKEKKVVGEVKFDSPISVSPNIANGVLYIATMRRLYALRQE